MQDQFNIFDILLFEKQLGVYVSMCALVTVRANELSIFSCRGFLLPMWMDHLSFKSEVAIEDLIWVHVCAWVLNTLETPGPDKTLMHVYSFVCKHVL